MLTFRDHVECLAKAIVEVVVITAVCGGIVIGVVAMAGKLC